MQSVSFPLEGKRPFLGEAPQGHGAVGREESLRVRAGQRQRAGRTKHTGQLRNMDRATGPDRRDGHSSSGQSHQRNNSYPSSAPDTMCSSLIRWIQSMEPLERECVRDKVQHSHQPIEPRHATADCLTGGHRRQAGIPLGSSIHAQSHPGPQLSHSTLG